LDFDDGSGFDTTYVFVTFYPFAPVAERNADRPEFSPDGKWIVYGGDNGQLFEIADERLPKQVVQLTRGGLWKSDPAWSPVLTSTAGQVSGSSGPTFLG
jgi:hypothetical protein